MAKKSREDITLETLYELKDLIDEAIEKVEKAEDEDPRTLIDKVEDCLVGLNDKTRNIYSSMISEHLSAMESSEMIESKKRVPRKGGEVSDNGLPERRDEFPVRRLRRHRAADARGAESVAAGYARDSRKRGRFHVRCQSQLACGSVRD